jgi:hypothetical protein
MARHDVYSSTSNDSELMNSTVPELHGVNFLYEILFVLVSISQSSEGWHAALP